MKERDGMGAGEDGSQLAAWRTSPLPMCVGRMSLDRLQNSLSLVRLLHSFSRRSRGRLE